MDDESADADLRRLLSRLGHSRFRSSFHLSLADADYARQKGRAAVASHARDLLQKRIGQAHPLNDGKQTPYRGHPVFAAQHATATCCRGCVEKWHHIPQGRALTEDEIDRLSTVVMAWIDQDLRRDLQSRSSAHTAHSVHRDQEHDQECRGQECRDR